MAVLVTDPFLERHLKAEREESGSDRWDEVWEGVYFMPPLPNNEHQDIQGDFIALLKSVVGWDSGAKVYAGVNVSDRDEGWQFNYRGPDVVVYLPGNPAKNCSTHWVGGPDFLIEIMSPYDRSPEKLPFYSAVGVREALMIDRDPWGLTLYARKDASAALEPVGQAVPGDGVELASRVLPLKFKLLAGAARPRIEVTVFPTPLGGMPQQWVI